MLVCTRAGVDQLLDYFAIQNRQAMSSIGKSKDWTVKDSMVNDLVLCATLKSRRRSHTPFVSSGVEMSDAGAEAVKLDPRYSWQDHSSRLGADVGYESKYGVSWCCPTTLHSIGDPP